MTPTTPVPPRKRPAPNSDDDHASKQATGEDDGLDQLWKAGKFLDAAEHYQSLDAAEHNQSLEAAKAYYTPFDDSQRNLVSENLAGEDCPGESVHFGSQYP